MTTLEEVVDEIYSTVKNVEPMVAGKDRLPSTACFLLYKLFTLDPPLTKRQMHGQECSAQQTLSLAPLIHSNCSVLSHPAGTIVACSMCADVCLLHL